jgi:hypothetical protein
MSIAGAMAVCVDDGNCTRDIAWSASPCLNNIKLNTPVEINISASSCEPGFSIANTFSNNSMGLGGYCPHTGAGSSFTLVGSNYAGFTRSLVLGTYWGNYYYGLGSYGYFKNACFSGLPCTGSIRDDIATHCENISVKLDIYYANTNIQSVDWTPYNMSYQYVINNPVAPMLGFCYPNTVYYPGIGYNWNSTDKGLLFNKTGSYQLRIQIKNQNPATPTTTQFLNMTIVDLGGFTIGECTSDSGSALYPPDTDAFNTTFGGIGGYWTKALLWFLLMAIVGGVLYFTTAKLAGKSVWLFIALIEFVLLIIGTMIHIVSWIYVIIPFILGALWLAIKLKEIFT